MNGKIDIIIPWLNPNDDWYKEYKKYSPHEHPGRIRDMNIFKYLLRSISENCKWVNRVFIVLYDESQKPSWLKETPRLKVIYHKQFIPAKFLPNFNSVLTDMHFSFIEELSDNFIFMNDDMFFMKKVPETMYFDNNLPVHHESLHKGMYKPYNKAQWRKIENNIYKFVSSVVGCDVLYTTYHLPIPFNKTIQKFMWYKYGNTFNKMFANSKTRSDNNVCNWIFYGIEEAFNKYVNRPIYKTYPSICFDLTDGMTDAKIRSLIAGKYIVCFNDGDFLNKDFEKVKHIVQHILEERFPKKCEFEK